MVSPSPAIGNPPATPGNHQRDRPLLPGPGNDTQTRVVRRPRPTTDTGQGKDVTAVRVSVPAYGPAGASGGISRLRVASSTLVPNP
jgi:hypothetical protein